MLLRPFLNDAGSCASYLFGCTSHAKLAVVDPHVDLVDDYLAAAAARRRRRSSPSSRRTCRPTTSPACPRSSSGPARPRICPPDAGVDFDARRRSTTASVVELGNTLVTRDRDAGPRARAPRLRGRRPPPRHARSRGSCSPATRS